MKKYNIVKTKFIGVLDNQRVYRHDMPHGLIKYSVRIGNKVLHNKVIFARLDRDLQAFISEEWQKKRMLLIA